MSTIPLITPEDLPAARWRARSEPQVWIRSVAFAGLCLYGVQRWARLMGHPPTWRLIGLAALAVGFAVLVPFARGRAAAWPALLRRLLTWVLSAAFVVAAFPVSGVRLRWVVDVRIAVTARAIGHGVSSLGNVLVPYIGHAYPIRLVMVLGAAILLLDAAAALAYAGPGGELGDGRRAAAALPLVALGVVPSTLVREHHPALQGLILFGLLALFVWGERISTGRRAAALGLACGAGIVGTVAGAAIAPSRAWIDYRAWAGPGQPTAVDSFAWNQTYGPLDWPQDGRVVFVVRASRGDYWKAEDLTVFDGASWIQGASTGAGAVLPVPSQAAVRRWLQPVQVTIDGMTSSDVIGGSGITTRPQLAGGVRPGAAPGTWIAARPLVPGDTYTVDSYSPSPSPAALAQASTRAYPWNALAPDLTLSLPISGGGIASLPFAGFHQRQPGSVTAGVTHSAYAPAYALARRLAARSANPYAFVRAVQRYLDSGRYTYDQRTATTPYPLEEFLFHTHVGYCQQFSGAMALLLRMGGVPARVAAGFTSGVPGGHGTWEVTDTDAHAWVEAWFPGYGWVRFDPTPTSAPALRDAAALGVDPRLSAGKGGSGGGTRVLRGSGSAAQKTAASHTPARRTGTARVHRHGSGGGWVWPAIGLAAVVLLLGACLRVALLAPDPLRELERALQRTGRPVRRETTLAAIEERFDGSEAASAYVRALRLQRYGGAGAPPRGGAGRRAVRAELASGLGIAGRLRALWALPPRL